MRNTAAGGKVTQFLTRWKRARPWTLLARASPLREESAAAYKPAMELKSRGNTRGDLGLPDGALRDVMTEVDAAIREGAIAALCKRAARQAAIARAGVVVTETGVVTWTLARARSMTAWRRPRRRGSRNRNDSAMNDADPSCQ